MPTADIVYVLDRELASLLLLLRQLTPALIATGGTAVAALGMLVDWGLAESQLKLVSILGSTVGVEHVAAEFPGVEVSYCFSE